MTTNDFPRCATCAHWNTGTCTLGFDGLPGMNINIAEDEGGGGWLSSINTEPDFGCINHSEIKEQ